MANEVDNTNEAGTQDREMGHVDRLVIWPAQCLCGHIFLETYEFSQPTTQGFVGFCWCGFCRSKRMVTTAR